MKRPLGGKKIKIKKILYFIKIIFIKKKKIKKNF